jgi:hypothetical protein
MRAAFIPITSRYHQLKVVQYVLDYEKRGASICALRGTRTRAELRHETVRRIGVEDVPTDLAIDG